MDKATRDLRDQRILALRGEGLGPRRIATEIGMSAGGVSHALQRLDGDPRYAATLVARARCGYRNRKMHPCVGCGEPTWDEGTLCNDCRSDAPGRSGHPLICDFCGNQFLRSGGQRRRNVYCSVSCANAGRTIQADASRTRVTCDNEACDVVFAIAPWKLARYRQHFCSRECRVAQRGRHTCTRRNSHIDRAIGYGLPYEHIDPLAVFNEDGWQCRLCHKKVNRRLKAPSLRRASLDHIVPLSVPGSPGHVRENVQCSHLDCNIKKNNRGGGEQMLLRLSDDEPQISESGVRPRRERLPLGQCKVLVCHRPAVGQHGFCGGHYTRFKKGKPLDSPLRGWLKWGRVPRGRRHRPSPNQSSFFS